MKFMVSNLLQLITFMVDFYYIYGGNYICG